MYVCTTCVPGPCRSKKTVLDPLELELKTVPVSWELDHSPVEEQPMLLTTEPFLCRSVYVYISLPCTQDSNTVLPFWQSAEHTPWADPTGQPPSGAPVALSRLATSLFFP